MAAHHGRGADASSVRLLSKFSIVGSANLLSRGLGFTRDIFLAAAFGGTRALDLWVLVITLPSTLRVLIAEWPIYKGVLPSLAESRDQSALVSLLVVWVVSGMALLVLALLLGLPLIMQLWAPDIWSDPDLRMVLEAAMWWALPHVVLIAVGQVLAAIAGIHGRFWTGSLLGALLNVGLLTAIVATSDLRWEDRLPWMAFGTLCGALVYASALVWLVRRLKAMSFPSVTEPGVLKRVGVRVMQLSGASSTESIWVLCATSLASSMQVGALGWQYLAMRIMHLPMGLVGIPATMVSLPALSSTLDNPTLFSRTFAWSLRLNLYAAVPFAVAVAVLAEPVILVMFGRGAFDAFDARTVSELVQIGAPSIVLWCLVERLESCFTAHSLVRLSLKGRVTGLVVSLICASVLVIGLGRDMKAIMLSAQCGLVVQCFMYLAMGWRRRVIPLSRELLVDGARIFACAAVMGVVLKLIAPSMAVFQELGFAGQMMWIVGLTVVGTAAFVMLLSTLGLSPRALRSDGGVRDTADSAQ